jgi:plastocyanin
MRKFIVALAIAGAVASAATAVPATGAGTAPTKGPTVKVGDNYFHLKKIRIKAGQSVTWKWVGSDSHNVVGKVFHSKLKNKGTYFHKFSKKGTYPYVCTLHEKKGMRGTVIVS